jgi:transcriptional regulator with XRE-family HTH domain
MEQRNAQLVDRELGSRIRFYRVAKKLSQEKLAEKLGLSFQQIQKYEKGVNRVGVGRLTAIAQFLEVSTNVLLGIEEGSEINNPIDNNIMELLSTREGLRLVHSFMKLTGNRRYLVVRFAEDLVEEGST